MGKLVISGKSIGYFMSGFFGRAALSAALLSVSLVLSGCAELAFDGMVRSSSTGATFSNAAARPAIADGKGRVYVYRTAASTKIWWSVEMAKKNGLYFTVDDIGYDIYWEVFRFLDLPEGDHEIAGGWNWWADIWGKRQMTRGKYKVVIPVTNGSEVFIRLDAVEGDKYFRPVVVAADVARAEMAELPFQKVSPAHNDGKKVTAVDDE